MTASCESRRAPPRRPKSPFSSWCFVGIILVALVFRLPTSLGRSPERACAPEANWSGLGSRQTRAEGGGILLVGRVGGAGSGRAGRCGVGVEGLAAGPQGCAVADPGRWGPVQPAVKVAGWGALSLRGAGHWVLPGFARGEGVSPAKAAGVCGLSQAGWEAFTWAECEGGLSSALVRADAARARAVPVGSVCAVS